MASIAKFPNYDYGDIVDLQHRLVTEPSASSIFTPSSAYRWGA